MPIKNIEQPLKVLITRPENKATALALSLKKQGIACVVQPLFDYQPLADKTRSAPLLIASDILIFVSVAAVEFAHASLPARNWQFQQIIAVGSATKAALTALNIKQVVSPNLENSEGLLSTTILSENINGKAITIVRGNGGREHLAIELNKRGAKVHYLESYQRLWRKLAKDIGEQWYQQQINCIVVTSNTLLEKLVQLTITPHISSDSQPLAHYWKKHCLWIVASQRIEQHAQQLGLTNVIVSDGASEGAICNILNSFQIHDTRRFKQQITNGMKND